MQRHEHARPVRSSAILLGTPPGSDTMVRASLLTDTAFLNCAFARSSVTRLQDAIVDIDQSTVLVENLGTS
jgi:hypothetical protein